MNKNERQSLIEHIVETENIQKQEDLVAILEKKYGMDITQATISRDIKEMALIKVPLASGGYRYSMPEDASSTVAQQLENLFRDSFVSIDSQNDMILIRTIPGNAEVLSNVLRSEEFDEIFAVVTNDDNILIICRGKEEAEGLRNQLLKYI